MRKRFIAVFVAVMLLGCLPGAAGAEEAAARETLTSGDWEYSLLEDGGAELVDYNGLAGDIVIPNELDGHPVTAVSTNPFQLLFDNYTVAVSQSHPYLATIDGVLFGKADRKLICYPKERAAASYEIPQGILEIGEYAFYECKSLKDVIIPDSVTGIGIGAFSGCRSLTDVNIPNSVTSIGEYAFSSCSSLTSVTIPDSVTSIGDYAFSSCSSLTSVTIPDSVTSIGEFAFYSCINLTDVTIPDSVTNIGIGAFGFCSSLTHISVSEGNRNYCQLDGVLFDREMQTLICYPAGKTQAQYNIPDSVTSIEAGAFYKCSSLTSVTIPDSVTSIGDSAFRGCESLTLSVIAGSYAEQYCRENGLQYTTYDPDLEDAPTDWLTETP